jgi:hypothetical protein
LEKLQSNQQRGGIWAKIMKKKSTQNFKTEGDTPKSNQNWEMQLSWAISPLQQNRFPWRVLELVILNAPFIEYRMLGA